MFVCFSLAFGLLTWLNQGSRFLARMLSVCSVEKLFSNSWPGSRMSCRAGLPGNSPLLCSLSLLASLHHFFFTPPPPYGFYSPSVCSSFFSFHTKAAFYTSVSISEFPCFGYSVLFLPQSSFYDLPLLPPLLLSGLRDSCCALVSGCPSWSL